MEAMQVSTLSPQQRRGALAGSPSSSNALHWTKSFGGSEHATSKLGARFHLRKLFLRSDVDELSQSELEFIVQYLVHETTIAEQPWWAALTHFERLEIVNALELHHVPKGEDHTLWFSSNETSQDCILLYGNADATPMDRNIVPVLKFTEGSVVGNMRLPTTLTLRARSHHNSDNTNASTGLLPDVAVSAGASAETWRRVKREQAFRNGLHHYNKLTVHGSADYFLLTSATILSTTSKAADRFQRQQLLQQFGLERFVGVIRIKTFESGAVLAQEDHVLRALYFIVDGECRASVRVDELIEQDPFAEKKLANEAATAMLLGSKPEPTKSPRKPTQLPIASLGPRSLVGDVSVLLGLREPATIQAVTAVTVLALSEEDYIKETSGDLRDPAIENMKMVALETMGFVLERVKAEAIHQQRDQTTKIQAIEQSIAAKRSELGHRPEASILFAQPARYQNLHNEQQKPQHRDSEVSTQRTSAPLPVSGKIPSVVQKYAASVAASQNCCGSTGGGNGGRTSTLGPIIRCKQAHKSNTNDASSNSSNSPTYWMTREQRKAALALSGLHSPLGAKSLGQLQLQQSNSDIQRKSCRVEDDDEGNHDDNGGDAECMEEAGGGRRRVTTIDDQLFLFPTMTRQRQLHARSLPLLPKYRGLELNHR